MLSFILNNTSIHTDKPAAMPLLDFIRDEMKLPGTKTGCREGDCGACTLMLGKIEGGRLSYHTINSCLTPLANVQGMHVVSIEGLNLENPTAVQQALIDHSATQCGFCSPGIVVSLTAHSLSSDASDYETAKLSVAGNICRCTGYKSIEKAVQAISLLNAHRKDKEPIAWMVEQHFLPPYFLNIAERLSAISLMQIHKPSAGRIIGGGTDLMVDDADEMQDTQLSFVSQREDLKGIEVHDDICRIGAAVNAQDIMNSAILQAHIPSLKEDFKLISSTQIRNMGTLAGNIINASPIGDLSIYFLALDASLILLNKKNETREVALKDFFISYKEMQIKESEIIKEIAFKIPSKQGLFNFEKVSKRRHLDIASVNTAMWIHMTNGIIRDVHISAGGVNPIPSYLKETRDYLLGKTLSEEHILAASELLQNEIAPISDIRGDKAYKRLLLRQLFVAHFMELFPDQLSFSSLRNQSLAP